MICSTVQRHIHTHSLKVLNKQIGRPRAVCLILLDKQFIGSTPDVVAFKDLLGDTAACVKDCTVIADKGFASSEDFSLLEDSGLSYVIPLRRGNIYAKGNIPSSIAGYDDVFSFNKRAVQCKMIKHDGFNIHIFLDADLVAEELADLTLRTEKKNNISACKKEAEELRRKNGKGRLTDEELQNSCRFQ